jgi:hypothetical protein
MKRADLEKRIAPAKHLLGYFDQQALASYRNEPEKYELETDSFEGRLTVTSTYYEELDAAGRTDEGLDLQFGYRACANGDLALVLWLPDLEKATAHQARWVGFHLKNPEWTEDSDERFSNWAMRYLEGSWDIDNGPKFYLAETMATINGLTEEIIGIPLFEHRIDASLGFPAAENCHRYQDAHRVLYGYLIDGISRSCLSKLATHLAIPSKFESDRTVAALTKLLPALESPSRFADALALVSEQRRIATHKVRPPAKRFEAFATFTKDLVLCLDALKELLRALEQALKVDGIAAQQRHDAKRRLPMLNKEVHHFASIRQSSQMIGKTIERVEYGERETIEGVHGSEGLLIHFTDGTILGIETGSNASNITSSRDDLRSEDFHVDLALSWVPTLRAPKDG